MNDDIYAQPLTDIAAFAFDRSVVEVFPDMIKRSVPGYSTIVAMTGVMAERYAQPDSRCYDLGCSLGASTFAMHQHLEGRGVEIIGVDNSSAMIARCRELFEGQGVDPSRELQLIEGDMCNVPISAASVIVLNFTLQFIPVAGRSALIKKIYEGMKPGGILILSEKICFADPHLQALNTDLHHAFKRANGYSKLEVSQKRSALETVLIPETIPSHQARLRAAGFASIDVWFQCFNFASLVAIK